MINKSFLVKIFGHPATLFHGDLTVIDRWLWIKDRLPITKDQETLIDIGCGNGTFTIGSALRGYQALGLSWDERNQTVADERAVICRANTAKFEVQDVRYLEDREDLFEKFNVAICLENIEHLFDDRKLIKDITRCLKPGGRLLLTAPYYYFKPPTDADNGPFKDQIEGIRHVRRGYTTAMLKELCADSNIVLEQVTYCSGFLSQKFTGLYSLLCLVHPLFAWSVVLPLRILPFFCDKAITKIFKWPSLSICIEAYKPRFD